MSRVFITDEGNDSYTADVTRAGLLRMLDAGSNYYRVPSAVASASYPVYTAACWLKSVIIQNHPATATTIGIFNSSGANSGGSGTWGSTSAVNIIARMVVGITGAGSAANMLPKEIPFNVYCASGISVGLGSDVADMGCIDGVTIVYQPY